MDVKLDHLKIAGMARPLRVAYLVDLDDCPDPLLDAIFAEAYSRWGGRRTLIVPSTPAGIDERYGKWLDLFDADIIYSFVPLDDKAVADLHERFGPAHLVKHRVARQGTEGAPSYRIELPISGLSSLSVLPVFRSRSWGFEGPPRDIKVLNKHWGREHSPFLEENFGFLRSSFPLEGMIGSSHPDLFTTTTLISRESLDNPHEGKDRNATHLTSEAEVLAALAARDGPLTLAQLSDWFCPWLDTGDAWSQPGTCIVVGNTADDRLLFWNSYSQFDRPQFSEMPLLRVPRERAHDEGFLSQIKELLQARSGANSRGDQIRLVSCSLDEEELGRLAERLRTGRYLVVGAKRLFDHSAAIPALADMGRVMFHTGGAFSEPIPQASVEFAGRKAPVPLVRPWHLKEVPPPAGLGAGAWMNDLSIDRFQDQGRYANQRDVWMLPRRLRLERSVQVDREAPGIPSYQQLAYRATRSGRLSLAMTMQITRASVTMPDDIVAIREGVCCAREWSPFDRSRENGPMAHTRFSLAELSDKGRYLIGVLALFDSLPQAFDVLMDGFWRDELRKLGGVPAERADAARAMLITRLRRLVGQPEGGLNFLDQEAVERLGTEALRAARSLSRERHHVSYADLKKGWLVLVEAFLAAHPAQHGGDDDAYYRDEEWLARSVQHLCQHEVLFQGRFWQCPKCFNRNWVGIDALSRTVECEVCSREEPAPVNEGWQFRANQFLIDAFRDHGTEALIWALWRLWDNSRQSFYYAPSLRLWIDGPQNTRGTADVEVDAIAVVDGRVHLVEAKSASRLDRKDIRQLALAAERIRPDFLVIACMAGPTDALARAIAELQEAIPQGVKVVLMNFDLADLDRYPILPSG